ncbi:MAG TPA: MFS transporter [Jatrophihabitantaceae bacterium]|nr:MFS transporter [Jatrophihabitantaceae bacterium]
MTTAVRTADSFVAVSPPVRRSSTFASLHVRNFRLFATGQVVSNTGSWVQRIAQDWLVLTLTGSTTAVGITTALQFVPMLLLCLVGGLVADRYPKRRILMFTQVGMAAMAALLAYLALSGQVAVWHVYVIAFGLGIVTAVDNPARQAFVNEMVGPDQLRNAVSINSSVFQLGGLIGPAVSGVLISAVGCGYAFAINAVTYSAPFIALALMRDDELNVLARAASRGGQLRAGVRYAVHSPDVLWPTVLVGILGLFTANLPVTLSAFAKYVFHAGAGGYGLLSAVVAVGSLCGALISARQPPGRPRTLAILGGLLAVAELLSAAAPNEASFCVVLVALGTCTLLMFTSANATVQLAAHDAIRGRVMGLYLVAFVGGAAIGGPLLGSADQHLGPRAGMLLAGVVSALAVALVTPKLGGTKPRAKATCGG